MLEWITANVAHDLPKIKLTSCKPRNLTCENHRQVYPLFRTVVLLLSMVVLRDICGRWAAGEIALTLRRYSYEPGPTIARPESHPLPSHRILDLLLPETASIPLQISSPSPLVSSVSFIGSHIKLSKPGSARDDYHLSGQHETVSRQEIACRMILRVHHVWSPLRLYILSAFLLCLVECWNCSCLRHPLSTTFERRHC